MPRSSARDGAVGLKSDTSTFSDCSPARKTIWAGTAFPEGAFSQSMPTVMRSSSAVFPADLLRTTQGSEACAVQASVPPPRLYISTG